MEWIQAIRLGEGPGGVLLYLVGGSETQSRDQEGVGKGGRFEGLRKVTFYQAFWEHLESHAG